MDIGLEVVVVILHIYQFLRLEAVAHDGVDGILRGGEGAAQGIARHRIIVAEDPLVPVGMCNRSLRTTIASQEALVPRRGVVNCPFIAKQRIDILVQRLDIDLADVERGAARLLQVEVDVASIGTEPFVTGNLAIDGAFVHQHRLAGGLVLQACSVEFLARTDVDVPDAIDLVPMSFVAEEQAVGVGGRELQMVEPGIVGPDVAELACLCIDGEDGLFEFGFEDEVEEVALLGMIAQDACFFRVVEGAGEACAITIDGSDMSGATSGELGNEACRPIDDGASKDAVAALEEEFAGGRADDFGRDALCLVGHLTDFEGLEIDGIHLLDDALRAIACHHVGRSLNYVGAYEEHLVADEGMVVEIERAIGTGATCEFDDAMTSIDVDPLVGHRFASCLEDGNALGRDDRRNEEKQGEENVRFHGRMWLIGIESEVGWIV